MRRSFLYIVLSILSTAGATAGENYNAGRFHFGLEWGYGQGIYSYSHINIISQEGYRINETSLGFWRKSNGEVLAKIGYDLHEKVNLSLCAGWTDAEVLEARWGDDFTAYYSRFAALADEAAGALLCYGGAPAAACYHSISNGVTEASQNVWTSALPYLQGVASPWDKTADGYETTITYSCEQVDAILQGLGLEPEILADTAPAAWFGAAQLDEAGYVASMSVCGEAFSGTRLRRALALRSTCFTVQYADGTFTFTTRGYGHCVGLSQHGAQSMAEGGADWREILTYYFPGCEVVE